MNSVDSMIRILVVDDSSMIRKYISQLIQLEPDMRVCAEAYDEASALKAIQEHKPDMVLMDISFGGNDAGIGLMKDISAQDSELPMLAISLYEEAIYKERAFDAGARGYLMKQEAPEHLINAIRQVMSGKIYVS